MNNLQNFLNSATGRRLLNMAEEEQRQIQQQAKEQREFLNFEKQLLNERLYGIPAHKDKTFFQKVDGNILSAIKTGLKGEVIKIVPVTSDMELTSGEMNQIKEIDEIAYRRLLANDFEAPKLTDAFYQTQINLENKSYEYAQMELTKPIATTFSTDGTPFMNQTLKDAYGDLAQYKTGKTLEMLSYERTHEPEAIRQFNKEIMALEEKVKQIESAARNGTSFENAPTTMEGDFI